MLHARYVPMRRHLRRPLGASTPDLKRLHGHACSSNRLSEESHIIVKINTMVRTAIHMSAAVSRWPSTTCRLAPLDSVPRHRATHAVVAATASGLGRCALPAAWQAPFLCPPTAVSSAAVAPQPVGGGGVAAAVAAPLLSWPASVGAPGATGRRVLPLLSHWFRRLPVATAATATTTTTGTAPRTVSVTFSPAGPSWQDRQRRGGRRHVAARERQGQASDGRVHCALVHGQWCAIGRDMVVTAEGVGAVVRSRDMAR